MTTSTQTPFWTEEDIISRYTRADALQDGDLIAAPEDLTRQAGISVPVALTRAAFDDLAGDVGTVGQETEDQA